MQVHTLLASLCTVAPGDDGLRTAMLQAHGDIERAAVGLTLGTVSGLVAGVRGVLAAFNPDTLNFVSALAQCPALVAWLLAHADQQEFNQMLNVVRPCTDEPYMLSAIASLVFIRTLLIETLYCGPPYTDLTASIFEKHSFYDFFERVRLKVS